MMIEHAIRGKNGDGRGFGREVLRGSGRGVLLLGLFAVGGASSAASTEDPAGLLERGREVVQARERLIADYTAWARELAVGTSVAREAPIAMDNSADPAAQFVNYVQRLARLRAVEALDLGVDHVGLTAADGQGRRSRPAAELLVSIGRPASIRIAEHLRSDPESPALREILGMIEGDDAAAVLAGTVPSAILRLEAPPAPVAVEGALPIEFTQIPGIPQPGYSDHGTKTVLDLAAGQLLEGPSLDALPMSREQFAPLVEQIGRIGDLAVAGNFLLIPTGRFATLEPGDLQAIGDKNLAPLGAPGGSVLGLERERIVMLGTHDARYALVQYLGSSRHEALLAYVVQPNGTATFPTAPLASPSTVRARPGVSAGEVAAHGAFIHQREFSFWTDYGQVTEALGRIVAGETPSANQADREEALVLLGQLRHQESASIIVRYLEAEADSAARGGDQPVLRALGALWPAPRPALVALIEATDDRYLRARLSEVLERLDGPDSARTPRSRRVREPARSKNDPR